MSNAGMDGLLVEGNLCDDEQRRPTPGRLENNLVALQQTSLTFRCSKNVTSEGVISG
jgi:hypothetical protein